MNFKTETHTFSDDDWKLVQEYLRIYDSPEKRTLAMIRLLDHNGCILCGDTNVRVMKNKRSVWCPRCRKRTWLTNGTFFENMRRLDVAHGILTLLERGVDLCAHQASVIFSCAYDTAWTFFLKLEAIIAEIMPQSEDLLECLSLDFTSLFIRRSNRTPAQVHPREEQRAYEDELRQEDFSSSGDYKTNQDTDCTDKTDDSFFSNSPLLELIAADRPTDFDSLLERSKMPHSSLSMELMELQMAKLIIRQPGELYVLAKASKAQEHNQRIKSIQIFEEGSVGASESSLLNHALQYIRTLSHGISRKYLQLALCLHWFQFDKTRWSPGELTHLCKRHRAITKKEIKSSVTPLKVRIFKVIEEQQASLDFVD